MRYALKIRSDDTGDEYKSDRVLHVYCNMEEPANKDEPVPVVNLPPACRHIRDASKIMLGIFNFPKTTMSHMYCTFFFFNY